MTETGPDGDSDGDGALVQVRDLQKYYYEQDTLIDTLLGREPQSVKAVDGVSFDIHEGETLGLVGESGCGKSTTGETLLRLREATGGTVSFDGDDVYDLDDDDVKEFRRRAQIVFQDPFSSLDPRMTVGDIVAEGLKIHGLPKSDPEVETRAEVTLADGVDTGTDIDVDVTDDVDRVVEAEDGVATVPVTVREEVDDDGQRTLTATVDRNDDLLGAAVESRNGAATVTVSVDGSDSAIRRARAAALLERVGLSGDQLERYPHEFSGGQRQRIGIARALALEPEFIVLDEPVSALDVSVQAQVLNLLQDLQDEFDLTYLFIAHDLSVVRHICDRVAVMYLGEVVELGETDEIFEDPDHPYTKALLESVPRANVAEQGRRVETLSGDVPSPRNPPSGCRFRTRCPSVIPPDDIDIEQAAYRDVMDLRDRIDSRDLDLEFVRSELDDPDDAEAFAEVIRAELFEHDLTGENDAVVEEAVSALAEGDWERAETVLQERFESVCETDPPELGDGDHVAACHLLD